MDNDLWTVTLQVATHDGQQVTAQRTITDDSVKQAPRSLEYLLQFMTEGVFGELIKAGKIVLPPRENLPIESGNVSGG